MSPSKHVDLITAHLERTASPEDLILVHPWYMGLSFHRHFHGATAWKTLPPIEDYRFHRYDLIKEQISSPQPVAPVFEQVTRTLASGHRVWLAGNFPWPKPNTTPPPDLPPAPNSPAGWDDETYAQIWLEQLAHLILRGGGAIHLASFGELGAVDGFENLQLFVASGFKKE